MIKKRFEILFIALVAFAPWHGIVRFLPPLEWPGVFSQLSSKGLFNLMLISSVGLLLVWRLVLSFRVKKPTGAEIFALLWLAINVVNFRKIDAPSVVMLECAVLFSLLLLVLFRRDDVVGEAFFLKRYSLPVFNIFYMAALLLPLIFSDKADIFISLGPVNRFTGWSSTGSVAYAGIALGTWGIMEFCATPGSRWQTSWGMTAILLGVLGQHLTVLRVGLLALFLALVVATFHVGFQKRYKLMIQVGLIALATMASFFNKTIISKSYISEKALGNYRESVLSSLKSFGQTEEEVFQNPESSPNTAPLVARFVPSQNPPSQETPKETSQEEKAVQEEPLVARFVPSQNPPSQETPKETSQEEKAVQEEPLVARFVPSQNPPSQETPKETSQEKEAVQNSEPTPNTAPLVARSVPSKKIPPQPRPSNTFKDPILMDPLHTRYHREPSRVSAVLEKIKPSFPSLRPIIEHLQLSFEIKFMNYNSITHGRVKIIHGLFGQSEGKWILGHGTGATVRFMQTVDPGHSEPHNDYLRIFFDHGLVGIILFLALTYGVLKEIRFNIGIVAVVAASMLMLTDNFLVYPIVCFLPLIVAVLLQAPPEKP